MCHNTEFWWEPAVCRSYAWCTQRQGIVWGSWLVGSPLISTSIRKYSNFTWKERTIACHIHWSISDWDNYPYRPHRCGNSLFSKTYCTDSVVKCSTILKVCYIASSVLGNGYIITPEKNVPNINHISWISTQCSPTIHHSYCTCVGVSHIQAQRQHAVSTP